MAAHDKTNKMTVRPAKTQISLGIRRVWSESSLCAPWVAKDPSFLHADSKDWLDWASTQADLSLHWAHMPFCWFCHETAQDQKGNGTNKSSSKYSRKKSYDLKLVLMISSSLSATLPHSHRHIYKVKPITTCQNIWLNFKKFYIFPAFTLDYTDIIWQFL